MMEIGSVLTDTVVLALRSASNIKFKLTNNLIHKESNRMIKNDTQMPFDII